MSTQATRLIARLIALQVVMAGVTSLVVVAFAQRLLLLESAVVDASAKVVIGGTIAIWGFSVLSTIVVTYRARGVLRAIDEGSTAIAPVEVLAVYSVPARLVAIDTTASLAIAVVTIFRPFRPDTNDLYTQVELGILAMTFASVAALALYVMARASVAKVLESVPVRASRDAVEVLEASQKDVRRVRQRLFASVAAPVAFVALGALLLVQAHVRAFDAQSRESDAAELARGAFEPINGSTVGRSEAVEEARMHGYRADLSRAAANFAVARDDKGETIVTVPLDDGNTQIRFDTARVSASIGVLVLIALVGVVAAGALGARIGAAYGEDVAVATRAVRATGAEDIIRGTRILEHARFESIEMLMRAIEELGGVFRQFASTQERAIEARAATERMRGLFLASMSHDLKAPLNAILGFAEILSLNSFSEGQRESVSIIEQRGRELLHLINTILDAARAEAGELQINPEWCLIGDVVMPAILDARDLTQGVDVRIVGEIQPGVPRILVDVARATQAITAVILVAVRFADRGTVHVRATLPAAGERLRVDVETTGHDLAAAEREKVFEAFKHADRARRHGSLGLGPSLARSIVELHGGTADVTTTEAGGTVFRIWFPTERASLRSIPPS